MSCTCQGYTFPWKPAEQECTPVEGDGIMVLNEECDDGNIIAGDGCSANKVESHYYCVGVPSQCFVDLNLTFTHVSTVKSGCNSVTMEFEVFPVRPEFAEMSILDVVTIVHQNISSVQEDYDHTSGRITAIATYDGDLTDPEIQVHQPFTSTISVFYRPIVPAVHYSQTECSTAEMFETMADAI